MKKLLQTLNDIRVLLNNTYTREYVLESVKENQARAQKLEDLKKRGDASEQISLESLMQFLKSVVLLMLFSTGSNQIQKA